MKQYLKPILLLIITGAVAVGMYYYRQNQPTRQYTVDSTYCESDGDCRLYDCTNCGNSIWIDKNSASTDSCSKKVPGLVGCECVDHTCKRKYER